MICCCISDGHKVCYCSPYLSILLKGSLRVIDLALLFCNVISSITISAYSSEAIKGVDLLAGLLLVKQNCVFNRRWFVCEYLHS